MTDREHPEIIVHAQYGIRCVSNVPSCRIESEPGSGGGGGYGSGSSSSGDAAFIMAGSYLGAAVGLVLTEVAFALLRGAQ